MTTPRDKPLQPEGSEKGTSLLELMFVLAMSGIVLVTLVRFVMRARGTMSRGEATSALTYANQRIGDNLRASIGGAIDFVVDYGGSPNFTSLHTIMSDSINLSATAPKEVSFSAQPVAQVINAFVTYTAAGDLSSAFGNELYFVSSMTPITFTVCLSGTSGSNSTIISTNSPCVSAANQGYTLSIDRIQFVALYLTQKTGALKNGLKPLRLAEWRSRPYARYSSLSESAQTPGGLLTATCQALVALGYNIAIADTLSDTAASYITINSSGVLNGGAAPSSLVEGSWAYIDEYNLTQTFKNTSPTVSAGRIRRENSFVGWVSPGTFSFAYNSLSSSVRPTASTAFSAAGRSGGALNVPKYAQIERGGPGFPGGFEVLLLGRPGAREVLAHYSTMFGMADSVARATNQFVGLDGEAYIACDTLE